MAKRIQSWEVSDTFWDCVNLLILAPERDKEKIYKGIAGGGRKPIPYRQVFEGIIYVLLCSAYQWSMESLAEVAFYQPQFNPRIFHPFDESGIFPFPLASGELLSVHGGSDEPTGEEIHRAARPECGKRRSVGHAALPERYRLGRGADSFSIPRHGVRRSSFSSTARCEVSFVTPYND